MRHAKVDKLFLFAIILLVIVGVLIFSSASAGLLARNGAQFSKIAFNQLFIGLSLGLLFCYVTSRINFQIWKKFSFWIFLIAIGLNLILFVPSIGFAHGGAVRWINLGSLTFQPSEFLKIGFVIFYATWIAKSKDKIQTIKGGFLPLIAFIGIAGALLMKQPDVDTFMIIFATGLAMHIAGGGRWRDIFILVIASAIGLCAIAYTKPYVMQRIDTFLNPSSDPLGTGYQIQQSLIAIGSGGFTGRGFGQSIQKFNFLPEPMGDSIFAVYAEEFGFIGGIVLICLYLFYASRAFKIANRTSDQFGRLLTVGIVILVMSQSFINIAAMLGVFPLSGAPLLFISQGGTALFMVLAESGIILNISRQRK